MNIVENLSLNVDALVKDYANKMEKVITNLYITIYILITVLVLSNLAWVMYELQFETVTTTIEAEQWSGDDSLIIGGDYYGENESQNYKNREKK